MVLVCSAIRDLISPISRLTVSVATADDSPAGGVPTTGGVEARGDRSVVGVCNGTLALVARFMQRHLNNSYLNRSLSF